jgi:type I restriction enzyme S subunit
MLYSTSDFGFIRSLDVQMNEIGEKDVAYVAAPNNAEATRTRVRENDVLLTITGSLIGRVARVPKEHAGAYISQHVAILRLSKGLDPEFLARFLSMDEGQRLVQKSQYGQTKPGLNFDQIRRFKVPLPSVELQKKFVAIADRVSARLMKSRALMCDAETLFSSLQQRAFRGEL